MTDAPKRIRIDPDYDGWDTQVIGWDADRRDDQGRYLAPTDWPAYMAEAEHDRLMAEKDAEIARLREGKDQAYEERNRLVALLAGMFPSGRSVTDIPGWSPDWHGCVYIEFPWGQASWHFHDSQAHLFEHLPTYTGAWDGHTTEDKYAAIARAALGDDDAHI